MLGGRGIFGRRKKTRSETDVGLMSLSFWDCVCEGNEESSMEEEVGDGKGISSVNFVPVASGMKFVMTFFPGMISPNGWEIGVTEIGRAHV